MPVGIKELERWKRGQETKSRSEGAMAEMIRAAHSSGSLNLSNRLDHTEHIDNCLKLIHPPLNTPGNTILFSAIKPEM